MKPQRSWNLEKLTGQMRAIHFSSLGRERQRGKGSEMRPKKGTGKERSRNTLSSFLDAEGGGGKSEDKNSTKRAG